MTPDWLDENGFVGNFTISELRAGRLHQVPTEAGVYVVFRSELLPPRFLRISTGGWFKKRDPSVSIERLQREWVPSAYVLYIGKADAGSSGRRGLRVRLGEYLRFGAGYPIGHWGGRLLWHLDDASELLVRWKLSADPRLDEARLLTAFVAAHGQLPFANLSN